MWPYLGKYILVAQIVQKQPKMVILAILIEMKFSEYIFGPVFTIKFVLNNKNIKKIVLHPLC